MRPEEEVVSAHVLHTFLLISTINIHLKWQTRVYSSQKMENNSWLIRPEEEVVSAHVLLTFDVRLQRCQLLNLWKIAHFFRSITNNLFRFSSVQMTGMLHFDGSGFPGASLHIVRTSIFWQNRYFIFRSQIKNIHESPPLTIFPSVEQVVICVWYKQTCQSQSSVRLGTLE